MPHAKRAQAAFAAVCDKYECALDIMNLRTQQTNTIKEMELTESQKKGIEAWLELWGSKMLDLEEHLDHVVSDIALFSTIIITHIYFFAFFQHPRCSGGAGTTPKFVHPVRVVHVPLQIELCDDLEVSALRRTRRWCHR